MVQLVLKLCSDPKEWKIVELQGQLETRDSVPLNSMHIGDLYFNVEGTASLIVGHHLLTGKVVPLEKPFAVLKKRHKASLDSALEDEDDMEIELQSERKVTQSSEYEVVAFIKQKVVFKDRPKPIVQKSK